MTKHLLASLCLLLPCAVSVQAQVGVGNPAPREVTYDRGSPKEDSADAKPKSPPAWPILGFMTRTMMTPIRSATGHAVPPPEEQPTKRDVARMLAEGGFSPAEIAVVKIKVDEGHASARAAAVRYLTSVDCHYYPEAEVGLIAALRADRSESVRFETAVALASARSLTERVLEALNMSALGLDLDGNPAETSERVRQAARSSLYQCMNRGLCLPPMAWLPVLSTSARTQPEMPSIQPVGFTTSKYSNPPVGYTTSKFSNPPPRGTTSVPAKATPRTVPSRPLLQFLGLVPDHDPLDTVDPRLRGLTPLGSERTLSISTSPTYPTAPTTPYNYRQ